MADDITPPTARDARIAVLQSKLRAREGRPEFAANCEEIRREIVRLRGEG